MWRSTLVCVLSAFALCLVSACSGCDGDPSNSCATAADCPGGQMCLDGQCVPFGDGDADVNDGDPPWPDADSPSDAGGDADGDAGPECLDSSDCDGGICLDGACCPNADLVCGDQCCDGLGEVCFANACVVPGMLCFSAGDCEEGEYCEPGLGDDEPLPDGGPGDAGADSGPCLHPAPGAGRCLELPPRCPDGEPPDDGTICITDCEYHPTLGALDTRVLWQWGPVADEYSNFTDVWATPTVGRLYDTNCDGEVNELDPPAVVFVSGDARTTCCSCGGYSPSTCLTGVLRVVDGLSGQEIWSLRRASDGSIGFAGLSVALGDMDGDDSMDIVAVTGEGRIVIVNSAGVVTATSDSRIPGSTHGTFGWGGGLAVADMNSDGSPEIAYAGELYTTLGGGITHLFSGVGGVGGRGSYDALSTIADLDMDGQQELLAGRAAFRYDGTALWARTDLTDGFAGVGDFDNDGNPETVLVASGNVYVLDGATGETLLGPTALAGTGFGGPPTVADFDGDGWVEIGVARADFYSVLKPDIDVGGPETVWLDMRIMWEAPNHDFSSSVTGSTVFDFEGDGAAEVVYNDECFLWVYDGTTGEIRFATPTTSFTATEASLVADVNGDGHAEIVMIANGANPTASGWDCDVAPWNAPDPESVRPAWVPPEGAPAYRGITVFGDRASSWVGTRTLWNQHTYHVSNICDHRDSACVEPNVYGSIPQHERPNWEVPWLNNFRQNVQDEGLFNAPDATVTVDVECETPIVIAAYVRNLGAALLPAGVEVEFLMVRGGTDTVLGRAAAETPIFPGRVGEVIFEVPDTSGATLADFFAARIYIDPDDRTFHECREDNNESDPVQPICIE